MTVANLLPQLPLTCLKTADLLDTKQLVAGKPTIIDFWTTKCTRCPAALDHLDHMATLPEYTDVQFVSICCGDQLDGARHILEQEAELKWQNVQHYYMAKDDKEEAKAQLGFSSVPYYVVLDHEGSITQLGNAKAIDFDDVPGVVRPQPQYEEEKKEDDVLVEEIAVQVERVFHIDDELDF